MATISFNCTKTLYTNNTISAIYYQLIQYSQSENWELCFTRLKFLGLQAGRQHFNNPERIALRRQGEEPGYIEALEQKAGNLNIKGLLLIKESQMSQVKEFSAFLCMRRCKSLGSLKPFLWYASQLLGPVACVFTSWAPLGTHCREWLQSDGC